jgi:hypothetical protein
VVRNVVAVLGVTPAMHAVEAEVAGNRKRGPSNLSGAGGSVPTL